MRRRAVVVLGGLAALIAAGLTTASCTVNPATGRESFTAFMPPAEEARTGRRMHDQVLREFGGAVEDSRLAAYVDRIGQALARHTERPDLAFTFTVLRSDIVNAFATPGAYVYVTRGLLTLAGSEAELAGVLAHEIGHVTARHTAERYSRAVLAQLLLGVGGAALGKGVVTDVLSAGAAVYLQSFSREQENEADALGVRYLARAGYAPTAMSTFLAKLQAHGRLEATLAGEPGAAERFDILATHPLTGERVARTFNEAAAVTASGPWRRGVDTYMRVIDGLPVGGDAETGFVKGRRFIHPAERFAFAVPPGFRLLKQDARTVVALGPAETLLRVDWRETPSGLSMPEYLLRVWTRGRVPMRVERLDVNGMEAATAAFRAVAGGKPRDVRLVAVRSGPGRVHRFVFVTAPGQAAALSGAWRAVLDTFRRLSAGEAGRARPLRLRVFRARAGDTVRALARRMAYADHRVERFRVLNGLSPQQEVRPGRWVKIVTD